MLILRWPNPLLESQPFPSFYEPLNEENMGMGNLSEVIFDVESIPDGWPSLPWVFLRCLLQVLNQFDCRMGSFLVSTRGYGDHTLTPLPSCSKIWLVAMPGWSSLITVVPAMCFPRGMGWAAFQVLNSKLCRLTKVAEYELTCNRLDYHIIPIRPNFLLALVQCTLGGLFFIFLTSFPGLMIISSLWKLHA